MSYLYSNYARVMLEADKSLPQTPRLVLMLLAERANAGTGISYAGQWLYAASGVTQANVNRAIHKLERAGIITAVHHRGRPPVVTFPALADTEAYPQERAVARVLADQNRRTERAVPREERALPREERAVARVNTGNNRVETPSAGARGAAARRRDSGRVLDGYWHPDICRCPECCHELGLAEPRWKPGQTVRM